MTANEIFKLRTGVTDDAVVDTYIGLATSRVISFLVLDTDSDTSPFISQIADIAVLLWQMDVASQNSTSTLGYESHSFSEGGVSESVTGANGSTIWQTYTEAIEAVLQTLRGTRLGVVRFL